jgi:hypothetical protein
MQTDPPTPASNRWARMARSLSRFTLRLALVLGLSWACLALTIDGPGRWSAVLFAIAAVGLLVFVRSFWKGIGLCAALFALVLVWWLAIEPRNDREWLAEVSQLASCRVEGDQLVVTNVRNFEYQSETEFTPHWEQRSYDLSKILGVDIFSSDWGEEWILHTLLSFEFEDGEHLAVSIETRKEIGEVYSAVRGFFRQYELCYTVADERDVIGVRAKFRGERVRLYRLAHTPQQARALLLSYVASINQLSVEPAWYNALMHNCTTSIRLHAQELGMDQPFNWRILANGRGAELLYMRKMVNTSMPFAELQQRSDVTQKAIDAFAAPDFSARIRAGLPPRPR